MFFSCKLILSLCCFLFFSLSLQSKIRDTEFIPIPKRKKQVSTTVSKSREIIEIEEKVMIDRDNPVPKRKKVLEFKKGPELKNEVKTIDHQNNALIIAKVTDSIRNKLTECWNVPANMAYQKSFSIKINLLLSPQGEVVIADVVDENSYQSNTLFRSLADSAVRAIHRCSPFSHLPSEHYHIWREITLDFILNG